MYTRHQGEGTGKILLQPNQAPRSDKSTDPKAPTEQKDSTQKPDSAPPKSPDTEPKSENTEPTVTENTPKKRGVSQYKARRPERKEPPDESRDEAKKIASTEPKQEKEQPDDRTRNPENEDFFKRTAPPSPPPCVPRYTAPQRCGLGALLDGYSTDELLILAIIILLIMQGSDDILVLALCYVIL